METPRANYEKTISFNHSNSCSNDRHDRNIRFEYGRRKHDIIRWYYTSGTNSTSGNMTSGNATSGIADPLNITTP